MPKLTKAQAKAVDATEDPYGLMDAHVGRAALREVTTGENSQGAYWKWNFQFEADSQYPKRYISYFTPVEGDYAYKLAGVFEAFGVSVETDTDELIGQTLRLKVGQYTQSRTGEVKNVVNGALADTGSDGGSEDLPF